MFRSAHRHLLLLVALLALGAMVGCARLHPLCGAVTTHSLLDEMLDPASLARLPNPAYDLHAVSSRDRRSLDKRELNDEGWFANGDFSNYLGIEDNGHGELECVLLDATGPGAVVRMWFTCTTSTEQVRVYVDDRPEPVLAGTLAQLFAQQYAAPYPLTNLTINAPGQTIGGMNLALPIPFARRCKVTWAYGNTKQSRYYNIEYRKYAADVRVASYHKGSRGTDPERIALAAQALESWPAVDGEVLSKSLTLEPGKSGALNLPQGEHAIRELTLKVNPSISELALRRLVLALDFDGQQTVWAPVSDFFTSGVGLNALRNVRCQVDQAGLLTCRWVMPYQSRAKVTLINLDDHAQTVEVGLNTTPWRWDDRSLYFHGSWHQERGIPTQPRRDWNYVTLTGQGYYAGDSLTVFNPLLSWWGEGDEKIYIDGEKFPRIFGTGSEDYYNYAWCSPTVFHTPFAQQVRADGPRNAGRVAVARLRALDRIPFGRQLTMDMEIMHWDACLVDYAATTYWYARPGARGNVLPDPVEALAPLPREKAAEPTS